MFFNNQNRRHDLYENMANKHERFGIRKLTIGAVSVLLGATFWLSGTRVQAAEMSTSPAEAETSQVKNDKQQEKSAASSSSASQTVENQTTGNTAEKQARDSGATATASDTTKENVTEGTATSVSGADKKAVQQVAKKDEQANKLSKDKKDEVSKEAKSEKLQEASDTSKTDPQTEEIRTITVKFIDAETGKAMSELVPNDSNAKDAQLQVRYTRTATKDSAGKVTYGNWQWDQNWGDTDHPGYHVVSGSWSSLPEYNWYVIANVPNISGYKSFNQGNWEKNKDGSQFSYMANRFCFPGWSEVRDGKREEAYSSDNFNYDTTPTHVVYYVPTATQTKDITVLQGSTEPDANNVVNLPAGAADHTTSWTQNVNTDSPNQGEITVKYFNDDRMTQTFKVNVSVVPKVTAKNGVEFHTDGSLFDGTAGSIQNGNNQGQLLINTPSEGLSYTPTYSVSGLQYDANGKLVSGNQTATIRVSVPKGTIGAQTDADGNSYYEVTSHIVVAQPVTFEFVNQYGQVVGPTYSQEFIAGKTADLKTALKTPENCTLNGSTIPTSYTLPAFTTDKAVFKISVNETLNFNIVYWDDTDNKQLAKFNIKNPASGGYSPLTSDLTAKGITYDKYQIVKITGVPNGVSVSGNYWDDNAWAIPNYKWTSSDSTVMGANFVFHLKHVIATVSGSDPSSIPSGTKESDFRRTINRTINQVLPSGTSLLQKQDAVVTRTRQYDKAAGKFVGDYSDWTTSSWGSYNPATPGGYYLDKIEQTVDGGQSTEISKIDSASVNVDTKPVTINVIYKDRQMLIILLLN